MNHRANDVEVQRQLIAMVLASGGQIVVDRQHSEEAEFKMLLVSRRVETGEVVFTAVNRSEASAEDADHRGTGEGLGVSSG